MKRHDFQASAFFHYFCVPRKSNIFLLQCISVETPSCEFGIKKKVVPFTLSAFSMVLVPSDGLQFTDGDYSVDMPQQMFAHNF